MNHLTTDRPRCRRCGGKLHIFNGVPYCPDCTSYIPATDEQPARPRDRTTERNETASLEPTRDTAHPEGL